ncbi:hypothetical protein AVEN_156429-1 [Araneus ventricosus]|uniref:BTB domain-containing protein n=1 Tax=Araneus ventricosus TaxID=182803 RepID=A0A4Y2SXP1_ARAVE|nr:hypothetical protein AVEN_124926-1 [Araneus ventricosus]GBN93309.1 hypothetical protein AVEN_156429-1 [Araneus ventricosus]
MAASNTGGVLLKAEEPKVIKIPNFSRLLAGYVEGGLYLQDAALKTIVVRVYPCGRRDSKTKDYVCVLFKKQWIRNFPLNFHCTASIIDIYGERKYSQTCGMEALEQDFEIDRFVKRSTLFENDLELLPNDTLTVLCEVSYTMSSSQKSSKIWSVLSRLYAWYPPKKDDFCETQEREETCSLVVETMDGGEFLLPTPSSYFKIETEEITESSGEELCESIQESENSKILSSASLGNSVKDASIQSQISSRTGTASTFSSSSSTQTAPLKNAFKKNSTTSDKKDLSSLISNFSSANEKNDMSDLISTLTAVLSSKNLLSEKANERAITKESIPLHTSDSKERTPSPFSAKTLFKTDYKNKTLSEVQISDRAVLSKERIPDIKKSISNTRSKVKRIKPKPEATVASNTKILDLGSRKTVQGSGVCEASPVFARMLKTPMLENSTKRVKLRNIDADTFDNFLYYLEAHEIIAETFEKLCDLYEMADQYEVMDLMDDCALRLFQSIDVHNFLIVLELASMHSDDKLKRKVHKFFLQNEMDIIFLLQNDPAFLKWYDSWEKEDISSNIETSDDEIEVCDNDLNFYR